VWRNVNSIAKQALQLQCKAVDKEGGWAINTWQGDV